MDEIKAGDLVVVVTHHGCPCPPLSVGLIFTVHEIITGYEASCHQCGSPVRAGPAAVTADDGLYQVWRLQKINGPKQSESTEREKELVVYER